MKNKCLYCYDLLEEGQDYHEKCSLEFFGTTDAPSLPYTFDQMSELAKNVVERSVAVPGVQAKLSMSVVNEAKEATTDRLTVVGALGGNYIFKPPSEEYSELPANEHVTMRLAEVYGINVVPSALTKLQSGELAYITKRIDRTEDGGKVHMIDMFQITEAFDKYRSSSERVGKALGAYSSNTLLDKLFYFELVVFSYLTGNNDMHLKNFSMIKSDLGWTLAPAYDLLNVTIANPADTDESALTLEGKRKKLKREHFVSLGVRMGLTSKQVDAVFKRFAKHQSKAVEWIDRSFLSDEMKEAYKEILEARYKKLYPKP